MQEKSTKRRRRPRFCCIGFAFTRDSLPSNNGLPSPFPHTTFVANTSSTLSNNNTHTVQSSNGSVCVPVFGQDSAPTTIEAIVPRRPHLYLDHRSPGCPEV